MSNERHLHERFYLPVPKLHNSIITLPVICFSKNLRALVSRCDFQTTLKEWVKIEGTQNVNLNGKYTTPLMKRVIDNQEEQLFSEGYSNNAFVKNFLSIKGYTNKAATVFNHITAIRNFLGGAQASIANGLNPFKVSGEGNVARNFSVLKNEIFKQE